MILHFSHIGFTDGRTFMIPFELVVRTGGSGDRCGRRYHPPERVAARRWPAGLSATGEYSAVSRPLVSPTSRRGSAPAGTLRRGGNRPRRRSPRRRRTRGGGA